ncbi:hypothetical protein [Phenylobacterium sp.]|uniref:hypothetical protein n=1 Tax=Phenylobacterium sp. TaxID=1871053 RepID=UPI0025FD51A7|nr:hypothetical protein [Phenylobacterium sp.]
MRGWRFSVAAGLAALAAAGAAAAQGRISPQEAMQLAGAAGFTMRGTQAVNSCGRPAQPRFAFVDLNGDRRPEAVAAEIDPVCYGGTGESFSILERDATGRWRAVARGRGRLMLLKTQTNGWRDLSLEGGGCQPTWTWNGREYLMSKGCGTTTAAAPPPPAAPPSAGPPKPMAVSAADKEAAFKAAGFPAVRGRHPACDKSTEATIEFNDLNGDGRPDAVVTDAGTFCYGNTGTGYVVVAKQANGTWRKVFDSPGIPEFQSTRGADGWPDVINGGPGFCFALLRWNGSELRRIAWKPQAPNACAGRD